MDNSIKLDERIIQKVKDLLEIEGNQFSPQELYDRLYQFRFKTHPDLFRDSGDKVQAEEKFKLCLNYLEELSEYIKQDKFINSTEVVTYRSDIELLDIKQSVIDKENEIEKYKQDIKYLKHNNEQLLENIKSLESQLKSVRDEKVEEKTQNLVNSYKPTRKNLASIGITMVLTVLLGLFTQIEQITNFLIKYSPLKENTINTMIFILLIAVLVVYVSRYFVVKKIEGISKNIKSQGSIHSFYEYLLEDDKKRDFNDLDVYRFISKKIKPKGKVSSFFETKILKTQEEEIIDSLKDIFIYNLFNKSLIHYVGTEDLKQKFRIKNNNYNALQDMLIEL
ncbi:hypothetical protein RJP21_18750 [Paenibacillus sp. VCA1]|uniref:hypothetical protein n=1 Tax=Paenibacillus sp. VCA1 TaxID=3039148 RepID=UPI002871F077|nr:hypothetical protein [Paenibacillus sp. VCA1]MDR9855656.1 hypothetical protein [Paenibacillus sp. VCA1]